MRCTRQQVNKLPLRLNQWPRGLPVCVESREDKIRDVFQHKLLNKVRTDQQADSCIIGWLIYTIYHLLAHLDIRLWKHRNENCLVAVLCSRYLSGYWLRRTAWYRKNPSVIFPPIRGASLSLCSPSVFPISRCSTFWFTGLWIARLCPAEAPPRVHETKWQQMATNWSPPSPRIQTRPQSRENHSGETKSAARRQLCRRAAACLCLERNRFETTKVYSLCSHHSFFLLCCCSVYLKK